MRNSGPSALKVAIDVYHVPSRIRSVRVAPLPANVAQVLRIAAGEAEAGAEAAREAQRTEQQVREASAFFIEQILLSPESDSYRVLGAARDALAPELRRNMALLLRWLHPDLDPGGERSMFAARVLGAWENLKTPDRRSSYDAALPAEVPAMARRVGPEAQQGVARSRSRTSRAGSDHGSQRERTAQGSVRSRARHSELRLPLLGRMLSFLWRGRA